MQYCVSFSGMEIDAAVVLVLIVVEFHFASFFVKGLNGLWNLTFNLYDLRRQPAGFSFYAQLGSSIAHEAQKTNPAGLLDNFINLA